jgi:hypothetical protein
MIYLEDNLFPKRSIPLESSFSSSNVGNKNDKEEELSKRKIRNIVSMNIGAQENQNILKIGAHV